MPHASAVGNPAAQQWSRALGGRAPDRFARSRRTTRPALIEFSYEQPGLETRRGAPTRASLPGDVAPSGGGPANCDPQLRAAFPTARSAPGPFVPFGSWATVLGNWLAQRATPKPAA